MRFFKLFLELLRIIGLMVISFIPLELINNLFLTLIYTEGSRSNPLIQVAYVLQMIGLLVLLTVYYNRRLQYTGFYQDFPRPPFSNTLTRRLLWFGFTCIVLFYPLTYLLI